MITHHETIPVIGNTSSHLGAKEDVLFFYTDRNAVTGKTAQWAQ